MAIDDARQKRAQEFGVWLRKQLSDRDMEQAELVRLVKVSSGLVSRWYSGATLPGSHNAIKIADAFRMDPDIVLDLAAWSREWSSELDSLPYAERRLLLDAFGVEVTLKRRKGPGPRVTVTLTRVPTAAGASILARTARSGCQEVWVRL